MKAIFGNRIKLSRISDANDFVDYWNDLIEKYGYVARADLYDYFDYFSNAYVDRQYGWDKKISAKKNLRVYYDKEHVYWKLNLPKEKRLKHKN